MQWEDWSGSCKTLNLEVGAGNFEAERLDVTEMLDVSVGVGNAEISDGSYPRVKVDCGIGNVVLCGEIAKDLTAHCGMGNLELDIRGAEDDYNYEMTCGVGAIAVNDIEYSNLGSKREVVHEGAQKKMVLDCGMGNIQVSFAESL